MLHYILILILATAHATTTGQKSVNYQTGMGIDILNCAGQEKNQLAKDMLLLLDLGVQWVRIETTMTAVTALPKPPMCPAPTTEFQHLNNIISGINGIGAHTLLNITGWHYPQSLAPQYKSWLKRLLAAIPKNIQAFEIGNEENQTNSAETPNADPDQHPYGWDFGIDDLANTDRSGNCPTDPVKLADIRAAVARYVTWLMDTEAIIHAERPQATVVIGAISSWQPNCWLTLLGEMQAYNHADAWAFHPYPYPSDAVTGANGELTLDNALQLVQSWAKQLPVWITEYGFSTNTNDIAVVKTEEDKATQIHSEYDLLKAQSSAPIFLWTARDWPTKSIDWAGDCTPGKCPAAVGGFGLFEWLHGKPIKLKAFQEFKSM
jgi:hypothetical protein